jgi:hypothetical protein
MDKLTRYNQKLLAIIGTIVLAAGAIAIVISMGLFIVSLIDFSDSSNNNGLRAQNQQTTNTDSVEVVRTQEISFSTPYQLDTAQAKYIIPVGQVDLELSEKVSYEMSKLASRSNDYRYTSYYGLFNNFIYFNDANDVKKKLFEGRIVITRWDFLKMDSVEMLLFQGTTSDHNKDGHLNDDYQSLYAYFIDNGEMKTYAFEHKTVLGFEPMKKTHYIAVSLGIDKNKDFDFESSHEPQEVVLLDIKTGTIKKLISDEMKMELQQAVDGISE